MREVPCSHAVLVRDATDISLLAFFPLQPNLGLISDLLA